MTSDSSSEGPQEFSEAQAEAKVAAARARALRPWYRKKRYILGVPLGAVVLLVVLGGLVGDTEGDGPPSLSGGQVVEGPSGTSSSSDAESPPTIGQIVQVGSLDFVVNTVDIEFNSKQYNQFNDANIAVQVTATNTRGDADSEYAFSSFFAVQLVDSNGIAHSPVLGCAGCPDEIGSVDLVRGGHVTGWIYFEVPAGRRLVELIYEPLFSRNKVRISLR